MKIIHSFVGRFADKGNGEWDYYLIKPFFDKGYISKIILSSFIPSEIPQELFHLVKTGIIPGLGILPWGWQINYVVRDNIFDLKAARLIEDCDLFIGWSNASLFSLRKAKKIKAKTVIISPTSHVLTRYHLLREEYKRFNKRFPENKIFLDKQLREYQEADYINVYSDFVIKSFLENGISKEKLIFVPCGIDVDRYKPGPKTDITFRVLSVGRISLRKGTQYLLEAWSHLNLKDSELVLVGDMDRELKDIIENYRKKCDFKIYKFDPNIIKYFHRASIVLCPSIEESSVTVGYEALSCGKPVVASTNAGLDHIIKDGVNGFIIPIRDVGMIEEKIRFFYDNRDILEQMGKAAREDMVKNHSHEKYSQEIVEAFEDLVSS
jgi:glycosyltransferase involved in cell wall biosynthesis